MKATARLLLAIAATWSACSIPSGAVPIEWNTAGSGSFQDPGNWNPSLVPTLADDVFFQNGTSPTVTFAAPAESLSLTIATGDVIFDLTGLSYSITTNVGIGAGLPASTISLTVNGGTLNASGLINVESDGSLSGNGTINAGQISIFGGQLREIPVINGAGPGAAVLNAGTISPGNPLGITTINGDYEQTADGTLEIEVGGLTPGTQHDQLVVNGTATLAGRLELPFLGGFTPMPPSGITFLQAQNIVGDFDFITAPNLPGAAVAVEIVKTPTEMMANFVTPTSVSLVSSPAPAVWGDPNAWTGGVPLTSSIVSINNSAPFPVRVNLDVNTQASRAAFAHQVQLSSMLPLAPATLGIPEGTSLSALDSVAIGENGIIEMLGGAMFSNRVEVAASGQLVGHGVIHGDLTVGAPGGTGEAFLAPGSAGSAAGTLVVDGQLTLNSEAVLSVALEDAGTYGQITVDGPANLGGRLSMDVTNLAPTTPIGTIFDVILADEFHNNFDTIETVGAGRTVFLAPITLSTLTAGYGLEALVTCEGNGYVQLHEMGDMNFDGDVDSADASDFVEGLLTPGTYKTNHCGVPVTSPGDFSGDGRFDFDDIKYFTSAVGGLTVQDIYALISEYSVPEPTTGGLLMVGGGLAVTCARRHRRRVGQMT